MFDLCSIPAMPPVAPLRWLYLDLNSYFASVEQQLNPELRGLPIAVGPERIDSGTIIAASYPAKAFGIRTGMRVGEAKKRCPGLIFVGGSHDRYVQFHEAIVAEVWRHIPVSKVCSIDEVACRLLDNENHPDTARALAARIKAGIRANVGECLTSSIGIAPSRLLAKMAADMRKPDGLTVIEAHELPGRLHPLPLSDIPGVGAKMLARLHAAGIVSMADLLARAPRQAAGAWGSVVGARLWHALHGHDAPEPPAQSKSIGHSHVLSPQARDVDTAYQTARQLLMKAGSRLRRIDGQTTHLTLHARFEDKSGWHATRRLPATADSFALLAMLAAMWPALAGELSRHRIRTIGISLDAVRTAAGEQGSLFARLVPDAALARETRSLALSHALDRINTRFGSQAVTLGPRREGRAALIGTKIAFNRIPSLADFDG
jgi:DNA polymerase IV